jgi:hypothetical protein
MRTVQFDNFPFAKESRDNLLLLSRRSNLLPSPGSNHLLIPDMIHAGMRNGGLGPAFEFRSLLKKTGQLGADE